MKARFKSSVYCLLMAMVLLFSLGSNSYAYEASDEGEKIAMFLVAGDGGALVPCGAKFRYGNIELYARATNKIYTNRHIMYSYYSNWSGAGLGNLYNVTINKVNFYTSDNSYAGTSGILTSAFEIILPGDAREISSKQKYFNFTIPSNPATAKASFTLRCPEAVIQTSTVHTIVDLD